MSTSIAVIKPYHEPNYVEFVTWSVLFHIGVFVALSFVHYAHTVDKPLPAVRVTIIEEPPEEPPPAEVPEEPALLKTQRLPQPIITQKPIMPTPQQVPLPAELPMIEQPTPEQITPQPLEPLERRVLQDKSASDNLKLKSFTKTTRSDRPSTPTKTSAASTPMNIPAISAVAALRGVSTRVPNTMSRFAADAEATIKTLKSALSSKGLQKKGVGLRYTVPAIYPRIAKKEGWEGTVTLLVVVDVKGKPAEITVDKSSGHKILDDAAIHAVRKWIFSPAKDGNIPIRSSVKLPVHFSLTTQG
jgi:protein TonB